MEIITIIFLLLKGEYVQKAGHAQAGLFVLVELRQDLAQMLIAVGQPPTDRHYLKHVLLVKMGEAER